MSELADCINSLSAKDILRGAARTSNGPPFYINVLGLSSNCAEYVAVYDSFISKPSAPDTENQNTWVCGLVEDGLWGTKKDTQYNFAIHTNANGEAQTNWLNPGTYDCTLVNAPAFTPYEGFTGDGATAYIDTNWNPSANGVNYSQNSASTGVYCRSDINETVYDFGGFDGTHVTRGRLRTSNFMYVFINDGTSSSLSANSNSTGLFIFNRPSSNEDDGYRNGSQIVDGSRPSTGVPNVNMFILCYNYASGPGPSNFCTKQFSFFFTGSALTLTDRTNEQNRDETYMDANGKGVIP